MKTETQENGHMQADFYSYLRKRPTGCKNYRTMTLISYASKLILTTINYLCYHRSLNNNADLSLEGGHENMFSTLEKSR